MENRILGAEFRLSHAAFVKTLETRGVPNRKRGKRARYPFPREGVPHEQKSYLRMKYGGASK